MSQLWKELKTSTGLEKLTVFSVLAAWMIILMAVIAVVILYWERPGQAQQPGSVISMPTIMLEPATGPVNTLVTVSGQGWQPDSSVLIHLASIDDPQIPSYGGAGTVANAQGRFTTSLVIPADSRWESAESVRVIAQEVEGQAMTQALFHLVWQPDQPAIAPTALIEPSQIWPESTAVLTTIAHEPTGGIQLGNPVVTARTNVNVREGPGTNYPVLGLLQSGQSATVTGLSPDTNWWQIKFTGASDERGWLAAQYVTAKNTANVVTIQPPPSPATPTPRPVSVVITDWQGEYYNNRTLSKCPEIS